MESLPDHCNVADLSPGDAIEMYVIASNEGWEWVSATVLSAEPLRVRWWDGDEKAWNREGARIPTIRRPPQADQSGPRKAYYVDRITRGVTTALVYADNPADAKRRYLEGDYTKAHTEHEGRGWGQVRRAPDQDRSPALDEDHRGN